MPLKNLMVTKSEVIEKQIEAIVSEYVRYDPRSKEILLLPTSTSLLNRSRVLTYLVALQGWPFVTNEQVATTATPAQMSRILGIRGGTLRPILKELKDKQLVSVQGRSYSAPVVALPAIGREIIGPESAGLDNTKRQQAQRNQESPRVGRQRARKPKTQTKTKGSVASFFDSLISGGYFNKPRTLTDIKERFHEKGLIVPKTSIPQYLLKAIRPTDGRLRRKKHEISNKRVWVYENTSARRE
jgi:hypothetical protein